MPTYYLDGPSLAQATAVYTDPTLTICAPDGTYSDTYITRIQTGCVLGPPKFCPSCGAQCGENDYGNCKENPSVLNIDIDLGNDPGDTGVVIVKFESNKYVHGFIADYDGTTYNTFSSPIYGLLTAPSGLPVYIGDQDEDCGLVSGSPHVVPVYEFNGGAYNTTGTTEVVNVFPTQIQTTVNQPGQCVMVIPKTGLNPSQLSISVKAPCGDCFKLSVSCPTVLFPTYTSQVAPTEELVCEYDDNLIYYNYPVNGNGVTLGLFDWIFLDANGEIIAADGYYHAPTMLPGAYDWFLVQNGIIIQMGQCAYNAYVLTRCADGFTLVADSGVGPISIGQFVTISDPLYAACVWEVTNQTFITPTVTINSITGYTSCSDVCVLYSVDNMTSSDIYVDIIACDGSPTSYFVPAYTIEYICARVGSVVVPGSPAGVIVSLDSCDCGF